MCRRFTVLLAMLGIMMSVGLSTASAQDDSIRLKGGFYERLRHEFWKNNRDMESSYYDGGDRNFWRVKTSVWGQADYEESLSLYAKLTNEFKGYNLLGSGNRKIYSTNHQHWDPDEVVFDNLYVDIKKSGDMPVSFRIGRQDLIGQYGENFLICDGTPGDGSRTFYFNALKASWEIDDANVLDMLYINNPRDDIWLPVLNEDKSPVPLTTTAEEGYVFYLKNRSVENLAFEPYYIYKREDHDYGSGLQGEKGRINTIGFFSKYTTAPWTFRAQFADQFGSYGLNDRNAQGGYAFADYDMKDTVWTPQVSAGFVYLSGDNKRTGDNEGWDPLWCRFPIYSELYAQAFTYESGNSYWTNLSMYRAGVTVKPMKQAKLNLTYSFLRANRIIAPSAVGDIAGVGKNRGHLLISKFDYTFNKNVSAYLLGEYFVPTRGSTRFYTKDANPAVFVRTQLEFKF
ncbi:MAG: alginate export family protein [Candidatus Omnitrophota bacterium]